MFTVECEKCNTLFVLSNRNTTAKGLGTDDTIDIVVLCPNKDCEGFDVIHEAGRVLN